VWSNQYNNPEYAFLNPENDLYPFFRFKLWEQFENLGGCQNNKQLNEQLPEHLEESWRKLLGQLNGSELSVKKCQGWFMSFSQHASGLFEILAAELQRASDAYTVMNLFSLLDDILHRIHNDTNKRDIMTNGLQNQIKSMLQKAFSLMDVDLSERLKNMISNWSKEQIFSPQIAEEMMQYLTGRLGSISSGTEKAALSFPAGLLPGLCSDIPYTPLDSGDIPPYDQHSSPDIDEYLDARIKSFYDTLHDYRPGMTCDKVFPEISYQKNRMKGEAHKSHNMPIYDGSYESGRAGSSAKGLGYDRATGVDRSVSDFRTMRKYSSYSSHNAR
jgi:hypothetical protein